MNSVNICGVSYSMTRREQLSEIILQPSELRNAVTGYSMMSLTLCWSYQGNTMLLARDLEEMLRNAA